MRLLSNIVSPSRTSGSVPERVKRAIHDQQERSEILISLIQLIVVGVFALLYTISPKAFSESVDFMPVPWVLGAYLLFSLQRLYLSLKRRLSDWMLYLSAIVDIALLMGLIWSFHLQYEQPASFYLKSPTLLYVFIFISIRALHFDPRFVIASGISAAIGWMLMVLYVLRSETISPMVTRDYVEYMTTNSVLIGAEFDKIMSIILVTAVLALALSRARQLLEDSVVEGTAARDLSRFVPEEIAKQVILSEDGARTGKGEVSETTILFTDIQGFTTISERLPPVELIDALNEYFTLVAKPIEEFGGVISQFQGDAILATFGAPKPDPQHARNAVDAARKIQSVLEGKLFAGGEPFITRIGINTGTVVGGLVGSGERVSYTVHGDTVNLTARLEQMNKDFGTRIIISENTLALVSEDDYDFQSLGEVAVRGRENPIKIFTLTHD